MLVYVVLFLIIVYVVLDKTGVLADLANMFQPRNQAPRTRHPELDIKTELDSDAERRLEVFEEFIEGLEPGDNGDQ
jgi:hypothetical protein